MKKIAITTSRADLTPLQSVIDALGCEHHKADDVDDICVEAMLINQHPSIVILLGDMYRTLIHAAMAVKHGHKIAHLSGGDRTPGSLDDYYRNAITMLSTWHFPSCSLHAERLKAMGIDSDKIFIIGDPAVDMLAEAPLSEEQCAKELGIELKHPMALVCLHPEKSGSNGLSLLYISALFQKYETVIIAGANAEKGGTGINAWWEKLAVHYRPTYPFRLWLSLHHYADALIGNSSGFIFQGLPLWARRDKPEIIMVGDRQKGRWEELKREIERDEDAFGIPGTVGPAIAAKIREIA